MKYLSNNTHIHNKKGFSLIELSIVLIIVGLLVTGITSGLALVRAARISYGKKLSYNFSLEWELEIPTPVLWLDANDNTTVITDSDDNVSKWKDKSRNGNNVSQGTLANQPNYIFSSDINGLPTLRFDYTSDQYLEIIQNIPLGSGLSIFTVIKPNNYSHTYPAVLSAYTQVTTTDEAFRVIYYGRNHNTDTGRFHIPTALIQAADFYSGTNIILQTIINDGVNTIYLYQNGVLNSSNGGQSPVDSLVKKIYIARGGGSVSASLHFPFDGDIAEIIIFNEALTTAQRQLTEEYLNKKWKVY
ncbi:prepilin-type N-terminal cleavage/methylation domain-containing protein [Pseudomonadota bacterium]